MRSERFCLEPKRVLRQPEADVIPAGPRTSYVEEQTQTNALNKRAVKSATSGGEGEVQSAWGGQTETERRGGEGKHARRRRQSLTFHWRKEGARDQQPEKVSGFEVSSLRIQTGAR